MCLTLLELYYNRLYTLLEGFQHCCQIKDFFNSNCYHINNTVIFKLEFYRFSWSHFYFRKKWLQSKIKNPQSDNTSFQDHLINV